MQRRYENRLEKEFLDSVERHAMGNLKENVLLITGDRIAVNFSQQVGRSRSPQGHRVTELGRVLFWDALDR
jgi:hypothetical protein